MKEMEKYLFTLKVDKIVEHKDGSATIYFSGITKFIKETIKRIYKRKRWSAKLFRRMIIEGLFNYTKKEYPELIRNEKVEDWLKFNNSRYQKS